MRKTKLVKPSKAVLRAREIQESVCEVYTKILPDVEAGLSKFFLNPMEREYAMNQLFVRLIISVGMRAGLNGQPK